VDLGLPKFTANNRKIRSKRHRQIIAAMIDVSRHCKEQANYTYFQGLVSDILQAKIFFLA
jgi:retron-type reverse transcriptase